MTPQADTISRLLSAVQKNADFLLTIAGMADNDKNNQIGWCSIGRVT
jgi:hypothetical protein